MNSLTTNIEQKSSSSNSKFRLNLTQRVTGSLVNYKKKEVSLNNISIKYSTEGEHFTSIG